MQRVLIALVSALLATAAAHAQTAASPSLEAHVAFLASERLEGREAGSQGERLAAEYIAAQLARAGARPLPGHADMFLPFEFTAGSRDGGSRLTVAGGSGTVRSFPAPEHVRALSFSDEAEVSGSVVFAGYGLVVPESQNFGYDSYATIDVTDKVVVVLRYFPEEADPQTRAILARYSDLRYKAMAARQRGARALLVVTGPRSPNAGELVPMTFDTALAGSGIPAASISGEAAEALLSGVKPLGEAQQELDSGNPHVAGFDVPGVRVELTTAVVRERQGARNVAAYLPATTSVEGVDKPWIVIGAHYDHLGQGPHGSSLATADERSDVHHGADDNASGTAAVLAMVEALAGQPRARHVLVALWSAEEIGLIGSNAFVADPPVPVDQMAAYLNFDMVGRMEDNRLIVQAAGTSPVWGRLLERANVAAGFNLVVQQDPYQPTDVATFNQAAVASLAFFTGAHADYHKPSDTADKINYEDLGRIAGLGAAIVRALAAAEEAPQFTKVDQPVSRGSIAGVRVTTGTIPDYATDVAGLMLGGVVGGGPAERAGLMKGDVIVEIAGQTIANIYDYTYALELLKAGEAVTVVYTRGGERRQTQLTPAARR
jgi:hypothetical protein